MSTAKLVEVISTNSSPPYIYSWYRYIPGLDAGADTTSPIILTLNALYSTSHSYRHIPGEVASGDAFVIELCAFAISCDSANFNVNLLTRNDAGLIDTVHGVLKATNINMSYRKADFTQFIVRNTDDPMQSNLYLHINNIGGATHEIDIHLAYLVLQDREFTTILSE